MLHGCMDTGTQNWCFYWFRNVLKVIAWGQSGQINCFRASLKGTTTSPSVIQCELWTTSPVTFWYKSKVAEILDKLIVVALCLFKKMSSSESLLFGMFINAFTSRENTWTWLCCLNAWNFVFFPQWFSISHQIYIVPFKYNKLLATVYNMLLVAVDFHTSNKINLQIWCMSKVIY